MQVIRDHAPLSPITISAYRTGIAALVLLAVCLAARRVGDVRGLLAERTGPTVFVGLATASYQALYFASVVWVGVTVSTVVSLGVAPVALTLRDAVRRRSRPTLGEVVTVLAALTGLVLVSAAAGVGVTGPHPVPACWRPWRRGRPTPWRPRWGSRWPAGRRPSSSPPPPRSAGPAAWCRWRCWRADPG